MLYVTGTEARCGKSAICLGIADILLRTFEKGKVTFFRPLISCNPKKERDKDIELICSYLGIPYSSERFAYSMEEAEKLIAAGRHEEIIDGIMEKYKKLEREYDFILCEGTDFETSSATFEFDINAEIANNLGCPVLLVSSAKGKSPDQMISQIKLALDSILEKGGHTVGIIVNRVEGNKEELLEKLKKAFSSSLIYAIPEVPLLSSPRIKEIVKHMNAKVIYGEKLIERHVRSFVVAAMLLPNFLERIEEDSLIITPGDRSDIIVGCLSAISSLSMPTISGIMLTGGLVPPPSLRKLIEGYSDMVPILSVKENTFPAAIKVSSIRPEILPDDSEKIELALDVFEENVDAEMLLERILKERPKIITPKMFEHRLIELAKRKTVRIVLPEAEDERILKATEVILRKGIAKIILLGDPEKIKKKASIIGVNIEGAEIIDPKRSPKLYEYAKKYWELRRHKKVTFELSLDLMHDVNYFGTMMVYMGDADGMVSGAAHTTADTIRPALQIIKTKEGYSIISGIFFMCLKDRVLIYGDCAVNPDPDPEELAQIAIASAETAMQFGIEPKVALLSYSTGDSAKGKDVEKVKEAVRIAKSIIKEKGLPVELDGPMQYDAAADMEVAKRKMPESPVAGRATVFIFPDLDTGNNTYKAVQRSSGAVAIGPILQGLRRPVNDLSRGCTIKDIVNTVAITAIQAQ